VGELRDLEFDRPDPIEPPPPPSRGMGPLLLLALLVIAVVGGYVWYMRRGTPAPAASDVRRAEETREPRTPLGGEGEAIDVPPLDESDGVVRELVQRLSSHPTVLAWLATDGLVRNFTVSVQNIAAGRTPARHQARLRPETGFSVNEQDGRFAIDPASYRRYDALADAVASLDAVGAAKLYATLKPRIEEAYNDLGFPDTSFDEPLERAIVALLQVPVVEGEPAVVPKGVGYAYADSRLEGLTAAQKQLLRMGPRNVRQVQAKLREIARALGIPEERLPR
jgi:Protein of unknown function (DUF3014)